MAHCPPNSFGNTKQITEPRFPPNFSELVINNCGTRVKIINTSNSNVSPDDADFLIITRADALVTVIPPAKSCRKLLIKNLSGTMIVLQGNFDGNGEAQISLAPDNCFGTSGGEVARFLWIDALSTYIVH